MQQPENYYSVLGVSKSTADADVRLAYNALVESLRAKATPDTQAQTTQRMELLDTALQTLLNPAQRKRHDEKLDWFVAKSRLAADRAREADMRLKLAQEAAAERQRAVLVAQKAATFAAAQREREEARQRDELARIEAKAAEHFRKLREERNLFSDTLPACHEADAQVATQATELAPQAHSESTEDASIFLRSLGKKLAIGGTVFVSLFFAAYWVLRPDASKAPAPTPAALTATIEPQDPSTSQLPQKDANSGTQKSVQPKPVTVGTTAAAEAVQYQRVLHRVQAEHPELDPLQAQHRTDLIGFVASRTDKHVKEGYPRSKALDIAVRDLETQEQTTHLLEKFHASQGSPAPETVPVWDKGEHAGFNPKCRWVTPELWSCK